MKISFLCLVKTIAGAYHSVVVEPTTNKDVCNIYACEESLSYDTKKFVAYGMTDGFKRILRKTKFDAWTKQRERSHENNPARLL